jgi:hypothetical protein
MEGQLITINLNLEEHIVTAIVVALKLGLLVMCNEIGNGERIHACRPSLTFARDFRIIAL